MTTSPAARPTAVLAASQNPAGSFNSYSLDLSSVTTRQQMRSWDNRWRPEAQGGGGYEFQVDPGSGGRVGVWAGAGNPTNNPSALRDYAQFISAGPPAGAKTRVRMRFEHQSDGAWVSSSHGDETVAGRYHYEVSLQGGTLNIFKAWPTSYALVANSRGVNPVAGRVYWIYLTETRAGDRVDGDVTIDGELRDDSLNLLASVSVTDTGSLAGQPLVRGSRKRGFGAYWPSDGRGGRLIEWHVEPAPDVTFHADSFEVSLASGGTQSLCLEAGQAHALRQYAIFGSVTGTSPGISLGGVGIPLNVDPYTDITVGSALPPVYVNFKGSLDSSGEATAAINVPALPSVAGVTLHHAYLVYDAAGVFHLASNPVPLRLK